MPTPDIQASLITAAEAIEPLQQVVLIKRQRLMEHASKHPDQFIRGTCSYVLYGVNIEKKSVDVLASEPTSSDFGQHVTPKAKAAVLAKRVYQYLVEYRDTGSHSKPKVKMLCWGVAR
jgi:hypothetical protein